MAQPLLGKASTPIGVHEGACVTPFPAQALELAEAAAESSKLLEAASLVVLPFAHEDLAILAGAYAVLNGVLPLALVAACLYGGIVVSDVALYGLGVAARRVPLLERWAVSGRAGGLGARLKRNVFWIVAVCRVVPGAMFVTFVACGWSGVSLRRFSAASLVVSAVYLPIMLLLAFSVGESLVGRMGNWTWPLLAGALLVLGLLRKRLTSFATGGEAEATLEEPVWLDALPDAQARTAAVAAAERIPPLIFYAPLALSWLALALRHRSLSLPACANPHIPTGGMWGESKGDYFEQVGSDQRRWIARNVRLERTADLERDLAAALGAIEAEGIAFPLVAKPDIGWHGYGVRRIADAGELREYLARFPVGERYLLQRLVPYVGEAAVLYARHPDEPTGRIEGLTFRYFPHVVGDGASSVAELVRADPRARWKASLHLGADPTHRGLPREELARVPARGEIVQLAFVGNQRAGGIYRDARRVITPELTARFDAISRSLPDFCYGRYDIRFESSAALAAGEGFEIVEINGIGGEAIDVWDPARTVAQTYRGLFRQQRLLFEIAAANRRRGFRPPGIRAFLAPAWSQTRLIARYPRSE